LIALTLWALVSTRTFLLSAIYSVNVTYLIWGVYHLVITRVGLKPPMNPEPLVGDYPKISIIIPARNEPILARTIDICLEHVDYPKNKKEIVVVTDDSEGERIALWFQQRYSNVVKLLARKQLYPTKPSALNDAYQLCTGDIVAVIDVEDIPDKDIFLKAASALNGNQYQAAQAILRISNENESWITKLFSMEYASWFRIWLNGRAKLGLFTPLGGTGNYFKHGVIGEVGRWDATNLAEDAEIGIRLTLANHRVVVIDGRQWEEAPVSFKPWLKQRTRWFRGWLQSLWMYLLLLLKPSVYKRIGIVQAFTIVLMLINPIIVLLTWVAYGFTVFWLLETYRIIQTSYVSGLFPFWSFIPLSLNALYYYVWIKAASMENIGTWKTTITHIPHMFFYLNIMMPIAALRAFYQEIFKPVFWEKTTHPGKGVKGFQTAR